jgi:hypothetical protein
MSAHTGTKASISTTATTRAGTAVDLTSPCSRRTAPPSGESRTSMPDESDTRRARYRLRCARHLGARPLATRDGSQRTPRPSLRAGPHTWPLPRSVPRAHARGRESPNARNYLAEANRSAKSSPAGSASQRPSNNHRTPVRAELVPRGQTSHSIALRDDANPATLHLRCGSSSPLLRSHPSDRSSVSGGSGAR